MLCPCCEQELPLSKTNKYRAALFFKGNYDDLSYHERLLAEALADGCGRPVSDEYLIQRVWPDGNEPKDAPKAVQVFIHRIRKKMAGCSISVRTTHGVGYSLEINELAEFYQ